MPQVGPSRCGGQDEDAAGQRQAALQSPRDPDGTIGHWLYDINERRIGANLYLSVLGGGRNRCSEHREFRLEPQQEY